MFKLLRTQGRTKVITPTIQPYRVLGEGEYPICKVERELETLIPPDVMRSNAFTIGGNGLQVLKHRERLFKAQDRFNDWFTKEQVKELQKAGFEWFVLSDFIKRFNYHADLKGGRSISDVNQHLEHWYAGVSYAGDIPDFALSRIEVVQQTKLTLFRNIYDQTTWEGIKHITIHSMSPMPIELRVDDPVVVGWGCNIDIWLNKNGSLWNYGRDIMGVVIAAWDKENELR